MPLLHIARGFYKQSPVSRFNSHFLLFSEHQHFACFLYFFSFFFSCLLFAVYAFFSRPAEMCKHLPQIALLLFQTVGLVCNHNIYLQSPGDILSVCMHVCVRKKCVRDSVAVLEISLGLQTSFQRSWFWFGLRCRWTPSTL